jgi:hypothetical protein
MAFIPPMVAAISAAASSAATATAAFASDAVLGTTYGATAAIGSQAAADLGAGVAGSFTAADTAPAWLSTVGTLGTAANAIGGVVGAYGAVQSSQAAASASKYQAAVELANAQTAKTNAGMASEAGSIQAGMASQKTRAAIGEITANQAASGLDLNSGSPTGVRQSERYLGEQDALTIRSNATKEAFGYKVQAASDEAQSFLDKSEASADLSAGYLNAGSTLLSGVGTAAQNFAKFQLQGGFSA